MLSLSTVYLAKSLAGHDKGNIYVILREEQAYMYLSDGRYHKVLKPKKKNKKHVQLIGYRTDELDNLLYEKEKIQDETIKRIIKLYHMRNDLTNGGNNGKIRCN